MTETIMFEEGTFYGEKCFLLKVNGWKWTFNIASILKMTQIELEEIASSSYNAIILEENIIFKTKKDYNNMEEWIKSIFIALKLGE